MDVEAALFRALDNGLGHRAITLGDHRGRLARRRPGTAPRHRNARRSGLSAAFVSNGLSGIAVPPASAASGRSAAPPMRSSASSSPTAPRRRDSSAPAWFSTATVPSCEASRRSCSAAPASPRRASTVPSLGSFSVRRVVQAAGAASGRRPRGLPAAFAARAASSCSWRSWRISQSMRNARPALPAPAKHRQRQHVELLAHQAHQLGVDGGRGHGRRARLRRRGGGRRACRHPARRNRAGWAGAGPAGRWGRSWWPGPAGGVGSAAGLCGRRRPGAGIAASQPAARPLPAFLAAQAVERRPPAKPRANRPGKPGCTIYRGPGSGPRGTRPSSAGCAPAGRRGHAGLRLPRQLRQRALAGRELLQVGFVKQAGFGHGARQRRPSAPGHQRACAGRAAAAPARERRAWFRPAGSAARSRCARRRSG